MVSGMTELAEITAATGIPKPSVLRLMAILIDEGYVSRTSRGSYRLTSKLWRLATLIIHPLDLREHVRPALQGLVNETGETAHYSVYEEGRTVYVDKVDGLHPLRWYTKVGSTGPAHATATGKVLLAAQTDEEIRRVAALSEGYTGTTHRGVEAIFKEMTQIRRNGYAVNRGEWRKEVWGVAAPVKDLTGDVIAAVGTSGPKDRVASRLDEFIDATLRAATSLTQPGEADGYLFGARRQQGADREDLA